MHSICDDLFQTGYANREAFLEPHEVADLVADLRAHQSRGRFHAAQIGRAAGRQLEAQVRGDSIAWLDESQSSCDIQKLVFLRLQELKDKINRTLFLGLWELEAHYAVYPPGGFYRRHLDCFEDSDLRVVTVILYLNQNWQPADGGELRIFTSGGKELLVAPRGGTLVCFLSSKIEHEVTESRAERLSLSGWFRRNSARGSRF